MSLRTVSVVVLSTFLALPALACEPSWIPQMTTVPETGPDAVVPLNGSIYLHRDSGLAELHLIRDPNGAQIKWVIGPTDFDPSLDQARPIGGWLLGAYEKDIGRLDEVELEPAWTVVDEVDDAPPEILDVTWQGYDAKAPEWCYSAEAPRVRVHASADEPVLWYRRVLREGEDPTEFALAHEWGRAIDGEPSEGFSVQFRAIDLAGNTTESDELAVIACSGCSGSFAGNGLIGLGPLLLLALRRRRSPAR